MRDELANVLAPVLEKPFAGETLVAAVQRAVEGVVPSGSGPPGG